MTDELPPLGSRHILKRGDFPAFLSAISAAGFRIVGPTLRDGAIVYGDIRTETDLPIGWTDRQDGGTYRLERRPDAALFGYAVGPHSWKKYLFPSRERLWTGTRRDGSFVISPEPEEGPPYAFLGVRACELAAIAIQDRVFQRASDPSYNARRSRILTIAVQCGQAGGTCFCVSMGTGPAVRGGYDLALTEIVTTERHEFFIEVGSQTGAAILGSVPLQPALAQDAATADEVVARTAASMGRQMEVRGLRDLLVQNPEHP
ncbi:MAG: sulfite reductase subunit A, partial [Thermoplasmata archaeon]